LSSLIVGNLKNAVMKNSLELRSSGGLNHNGRKKLGRDISKKSTEETLFI